MQYGSIGNSSLNFIFLGTERRTLRTRPYSQFDALDQHFSSVMSVRTVGVGLYVRRMNDQTHIFCIENREGPLCAPMLWISQTPKSFWVNGVYVLSGIAPENALYAARRDAKRSENLLKDRASSIYVTS